MSLPDKSWTLALTILLTIGCNMVWRLQEPDLLREKGILLGDEQKNVIKQLGKPQLEFKFRSHGRVVSVVEYESHLLYYDPRVYEEDTGGPISSNRSGIQDMYRKDYRLVFIDHRLYSIEDFIHKRYDILPFGRQEEIGIILDNVKKR